jgi:UbiD family decarboxylase
MGYPDLRSFIADLENEGDLVRVEEEVDPYLEVSTIQHRVLPKGGPALLFEHVKGSPYRMVTNLFGTLRRVEKVFHEPPAVLGEKVAALSERLMPPSFKNVWATRSDLLGIARARMKTVSRGPILEQQLSPPALDSLPCLTCWPLDGGPFITLPLVHTVDPETNQGNLGMYRLQRFDDHTTGMHWQIEKGGGFQFQKATALGQPLPVSVFLGGPPALTIAAITPLPEGIDERLLAAFMIGRPLEVIARETTGHRIPARCEFVLEGTVSDGDMRLEGPFGDHLGHYSHAADYPVYRVDRMLARKDAIFPATVVGKPPQEDFFIGLALQEMTMPLLKMIRPAIRDLWSYPESGFHPLAVASVKERYPKEALKHALGILGEGQLSLTKVLIITGDDCNNVRDFSTVSRALWRHLDAAEGLILLAPTAQDTLDFTGPAMNTGSRLILLATPRPSGPIRREPPLAPPPPGEVHRDINAVTRLGDAILVAQVRRDAETGPIREALAQHPVTKTYLLHVLVSDDVPLDDEMMMLWGWFTRFDPLADIHPSQTEHVHNRVIFHFPIAIDATWKPGYRKPVELDPDVVAAVEAKWARYGIEGKMNG